MRMTTATVATTSCAMVSVTLIPSFSLYATPDWLRWRRKGSDRHGHAADGDDDDLLSTRDIAIGDRGEGLHRAVVRERDGPADVMSDAHDDPGGSSDEIT